MAGALEGIRVLDFATFAAAPYCGMLLADMGAEVIRVERPGGGNDRHLAFTLSDGESFIVKATSRNKKGITLDLRNEKAKEILEELVKRSDVVVHNSVRGTPEAQALSYDRLREVNPRIIVAAVSGFGQNGPYAERYCMDSLAQAASGATWLQGFSNPPDNQPTRARVNYADYGTGTGAAFGIMVALYYREKTGIGQMIDASLLDTVVCWLTNSGIHELYRKYGEAREQIGNAAWIGFGDCFKAKDGWVMLYAVGDFGWKRLARRVLRRDDMVNDPRFQDDWLRYENRHLIMPVVSQWVAERTIDQAIAELNEANITCSRVNTIAEMLNDPQIKAREALVSVDYPGVGEILLPQMPLKFSETPSTIRTLAPRIGEHNEEVYRGLLGFSQSRISGLIKNRII